MFDVQNAAILRLQQSLTAEGLAVLINGNAMSFHGLKAYSIEIHRGPVCLCDAILIDLGDFGYRLFIETPGVTTGEDVEIVRQYRDLRQLHLPLHQHAG